MWFEIARYTFIAQVKRPAFLLVALGCFFSAAYYASSSYSPIVWGWRAINTPTSIAFLFSTISNAASVFSVLLVVGPVLRDWDSRMSAILFTTPITPSAYLLGRSISGVLVLQVLLFAMLVGIIVAPWMPWASTIEVIPLHASSVFWSIAVFLLPNTFFACALFMFFAVLTKSVRSTFIGVIVVWLLWVVSALAGNTHFGLLFDPFGSRAFYQTVVAPRTQEELLSALPYLTPVLLSNRVIWLAVSTGLFLLTWLIFRKNYTVESPAEKRIGGESKWWVWRPNSVGSALLLENTVFVMRGIPAMVSMAVALLFLWSDLATLLDPFAIPTLPVTGHLLDAQASTFRTILMLFAVFAAGELVYRESTARMDGIAWALPVSSWHSIAAKVGALFIVVFAWQLLGALLVAVYASMFEVAISWRDFAIGTAMNTVPAVLFAMVAVALQYAAGRKYVGFTLAALLALTYLIPDTPSVSATLMRFADIARVEHSDVVGFGDQFRHWGFSTGYWGAVALALSLIALAVATWRTSSPLDDAARESLRKALTVSSGVTAVLACFVCVFFVRSVLSVEEKFDAEWTREAKHHEKALAYFTTRPQPSIEHVMLRLQFDEASRAVSGDGALRLRNTSTVAIPEVLIDVPRRAMVSLDVSSSIAVQKKVGRRAIILQLRHPLPAGGTLEVPLKLDLHSPFPNDDDGVGAVQSGAAFLTSEEFLPCIGYDTQKDIAGSEKRKAIGLPPVPAGQGRGLRNETYLGCGRGFATLDLTLVGPERLQAVTTGSLVDTSKSSGVASFHYQSRTAVPAYFSVAWGSWQKQSLKTKRGVLVEVLSVPAHGDGAKRLAQTAKDALEFYESQYGAYNHKQLVVVEVSRFVPGPRSFAGMTVIPETMGFTTDYRGGWSWAPPANRRFDVARWMMAHEVAHQWWGIGLLPSRAQGSQFLVESLAQYSTYRFLESEKSEDAKHAVNREMSDYFMFRNRFSVKEPSLVAVENQPLVAYRKGLLALVATHKLAGGSHVDEVLRSWYARGKDQQEQPILAIDLIRALLASAPAAHQPYLRQLYTETVLNDASVESAKSVRQADGKWKTFVTVAISSRPERNSVLYPVAIEMSRDDASQGGGVSIRLGRELFSLPAGRHTVELVSKSAPQYVEVDPDFYFVDPDRDNNRRALASTNATQRPKGL